MGEVIFNRFSVKQKSVLLRKPTYPLLFFMALDIVIIKITISSIVIDFKKLLFSTNSLARLLSDSLLSDSSISQSHSKL